MSKLHVVLMILLSYSSMSLCQDSALWLRYPAISPDGQEIVFNYKGDIFKVSSQGGAAVPLTLSESYEYSAVWSHDGERIAFASDRYGNMDVFVMPAMGGEAMRLTFHSRSEIPSDFSPDNKSILFTGLRQDHQDNVQFPSGIMSELYTVPVEGGQVDLVLTSPAIDARYSSTGDKIIYHDVKGYENDWRKHHTSAVTRDIWVYDLTTSDYSQLSDFEGEDRNPVFASDDDTYYYLSEESGDFNIYQSSLSDPETNNALTSFEDHPVRFLTISDNDVLCFSYHGEIYKMEPEGTPQKVKIEISYDGRQNLEEIVSVNEKFTEATLSPSGKEVAYIFRGEIFVSSLDNGTTKRITNTPWQERGVDFSPDGRTLVYAAERDNNWGLYQTSIVREEEPYFFASTLLELDTLLATKAEEFQPSYSPDGKEVAYLEDRTVLKVINLESRETRLIMPAKHNYSYADGDQWYQWSPDSKWFLVSFGPRERVFWREVGLIEASGEGELRNLTRSGYSDYGPKWSNDGTMMIWASTREGTRSESGWMSNADVYAMYFTQEAWDRSKLDEEEWGLLKEKEEKEKEEDDNEESDNKGKKKKKEKEDEDEDEKVEPLEFDWENMSDRQRRLTVNTSNLGGWVLSKDGEKLFYLTRFEGKNDLWETELRTKKTKKLAKLGAQSATLELSEDGKFLLILSDGKLKKVSIDDGEVKGIPTKGEMVLKRAAERAYIFDHAWRLVKEKFYVPDLHGVDWDFYYEAYKPFLEHINNNRDFAEMLSEMLGELNASHTGSGYRESDPKGDQTASLGLLYDQDYEGPGLKVAAVLQEGPFDNAESKVKAGHIIQAIDGNKIDANVDFYQFLNRKRGDRVLVAIMDPVNDKNWDEVVQPISLGQEGQLLYQRWVESRRDLVDSLSDGRLGYVHVRSMNDRSMRVVVEEALGQHITDEALIVDTRFNGGGNLHDVLSDFLNGKKYMDVIPHGQYIGSEPWMKWVKPSIVVMGESNYSDAHLFPVAYKIKEVGQTLGMPVPGTGTFVWWETQIDPTLFFGIPMGGWKPIGDESFLENNQLEPDIRVRNEPGEMAEGRDQQIEEAVKVLLEE
ncbi:MAG: S41 family peptidase [Saprospiraceae bacterium]|nr:S41 family peptidase [Saprospiraceae bacterium]